jgi:uncharacterized phage-associated protein
MALHAEPKDRLAEAAMACLQAAGGSMNMVNLNKALFYADLAALLQTGHSITGQSYIALRQGPVVAKYDRRVVRVLESLGWARQQKIGQAKPLTIVALPRSFPSLPENAIGLIAKIASTIANLTASAVSIHSHENPGWIVAFEQGLGAGLPAKPIDMHLALQQLVDDADLEWLNAELTEEEQKVVEEADVQDAEPWE